MLTYWISDPDIQSMYSELTYTNKQEVKELLDKYISPYKNVDYYRWAIVENASNICIGQIAIFLVDNKNNFCEIVCIREEVGVFSSFLLASQKKRSKEKNFSPG